MQPKNRRLATEAYVDALRALPYVALIGGDDLNTKRSPSRYRANSNGTAAAVLNAPTAQPFVCYVEATTGGVISQVVVELYGPDNGIYKRTTNSIASTPYPFGPWETVFKSGGGSTTIPFDTDLDTLREPGEYISESINRSASLINAPTDRPFVMRVDDNGAGLIGQSIREIYNASGAREFIRATGALSPSPYPFGAWADLTASPDPAPSTPSAESGLANDILVQDFSRRYGGRIKTGGKGAIAFRFDHGLANYRDMIKPLMDARTFKHSQVINSRSWGLAENTGVTEAIVDGWVQEGLLEIWNHGALGHSDADTPEKLYDAIVNGLAELRVQIPSASIDGWAIPGVQGTKFMGFDAGVTPEKFYGTEAGRLILANHAVSTGHIPNTYQRILDGVVRQGQHQYTLDERTVAQATAEIDLAIANGTGLQIMLHPSVVGSVDRMTLAQFTEVLDYVKTKETAGDLLVLSPYELMVADKF